MAIEIGRYPFPIMRIGCLPQLRTSGTIWRGRKWELFVSAMRHCVHWGPFNNVGLFLLLVYCGKDTLMTALRAECVLRALGLQSLKKKKNHHRQKRVRFLKDIFSFWHRNSRGNDTCFLSDCCVLKSRMFCRFRPSVMHFEKKKKLLSAPS